MKKWMTLLLAMAMLLCLCACDNTPDTEEPTAAPTTQGQPDPTDPADPTEPPVTVSPVGVYRCTGIRTSQDTQYQEVSHGGIEIYDDGEALIYFDDYIYDLSWTVEGNQFSAITMDETALPVEGILNNDEMEVLFDGISLRFQKKTQQDIADEAVFYLQEMMDGTPQRCAAAYLGWFEEAGSVQSWLQEQCPIALEESPFVSLIPEDRIIGTGGEMYCIVPADADASVTVSLMLDGTEDVREVLYQAESGEPFLLMCNAGGFYPDTRVTLTDSTGEEFTWYPQIGRFYVLEIPENDSQEKQVLDLSVYHELYPYGYNEWLANEWWMATEEDLIATCWNFYENTSQDRGWVLDLSGEGTARLYLTVDGVSVDAECYEGTWSVDYSDGTGLTYLTLDITSTEGGKINGSYVVLVSPEKREILIGTDADQQTLPVPNDGYYFAIWWASVG